MHLTCLLQVIAASGIVVYNFEGIHILDQPQPSGDGIFCIDGLSDISLQYNMFHLWWVVHPRIK